MTEQMAIITQPRIGTRDLGVPVLSFDVYISEGSAALQVLSWDDARELIASVQEVRDLEGHPCWVERDGNLIKFKRLWEPGGWRHMK